MKKITFCALALAGFGFVTNAQVAIQDISSDTSVEFFGNTRTAQAACSDQEDSNNFENGFGNMNAGTQVADDFQVPQGETFELEALTVNIINDGGYDDIDVGIYADDNGLPGEEIFFDTLDVEDIQLIGTAFSRQVFEIVVEFPSGIILEGNNDEESNFWVSVTTPNPLDANSDAFWETTTATSSTTLSAFRNVADPENPTDWANNFVNGNGENQDMPPATVFIIEGDCQALSLEDNVLNSISIYPNPATNVINLDIKNNISIETVAVYDILGKRTNATLTGNTINIASLNSGLYMVEVTTENGNTATYKVVKQ